MYICPHCKIQTVPELHWCFEGLEKKHFDCMEEAKKQSLRDAEKENYNGGDYFYYNRQMNRRGA